MQPEPQVLQYPSSSPFDSPVSSELPERRMPLDFGDYTSHDSDDFDDKFSFDDFDSTQQVFPEQGQWHAGGIVTNNQMQFIDNRISTSQVSMEHQIEIQVFRVSICPQKKD